MGITIKVKSIMKFFYKKYFVTSLPLEYRICMIFLFSLYFMFIISATINMLIGRIVMSTSQWLAIVFYTYIASLPVKLQMRIYKIITFSIVFVAMPYFFFQTAGYDGTCLIYITVSGFVIAITFKRMTRVLIVTGLIITFAGLCVAQYLYPEIVKPYDSPLSKLVDHINALSLCVILLASITTYVSSAFAAEEKLIKKLLEDMEQSNTKLAEMSYRDALTGAYNRRYLTESMLRIRESCNVTGKSIHFMLLDLDKFKDINDKYGHGFGDEVLIATVKAISSVLRKSDIFVRFGGEEFAVIIYGAEDSIAVIISERICESVRLIKFRNNVEVTISIGLVKSRPDETHDEIYKRADKQLYRAKNEGRNRVCYDF